MPKEQSQIRERQNTNLREPRRYKVIIHNDDFTTMEFVVLVLKQVFFMNEENAQALMLKVHHSNKAVVGMLLCQKHKRQPTWPVRMAIRYD